MKENLQSLLNALRAELSELKAEKHELDQQLAIANATRRSAARECLVELLPNIEMSTVRKLQDDVPGFSIPLVPKWFGLTKRVDPSVSIDMLRMQLGAHIDNNLPNELFAPRAWRNIIAPLDDSIRGLQVLIRGNSERLSDVNDRIRAIEKLLGSDLGKMDPKIRVKMEQAAQVHTTRAASYGRPYRFGRKQIPVQPAYPNATQVSSDSGPDLLEMWFWYQLLTPHTEVSHEMTRIEGGGGEFGGGGASGSFSSDATQSSVPNDGLPDSSSALDAVAITAVADVAAGNDSIETHYDHGAGNFS